MLSRGDNLGVGGEQDVEAKALRSVRWYARRWREKFSKKWLQSWRRMSSPPQAAGHPDPQRWIDIKQNQCPITCHVSTGQIKQRNENRHSQGRGQEYSKKNPVTGVSG